MFLSSRTINAIAYRLYYGQCQVVPDMLEYKHILDGEVPLQMIRVGPITLRHSDPVVDNRLDRRNDTVTCQRNRN